MASEVDIANRALSKLGESRITSMDDASKPARAMKARFALLRDAEIEAGAWRFAVVRVHLPAATSVPIWGYSKIYERPVDDLRPLTVGGGFINERAVGVYYSASSQFNLDDPPYQIVGGNIHTDMSAPLEYEYVARVTNTGAFNSLFVEVLACRLAVDAAEELTQSNSKTEVVMMQYKQAMAEARRTHALWVPPRRHGPSRFQMARFY